MRLLPAAFVALLALGSPFSGSRASAQTCGAGATTTVSGTVYAPNGVDPLPDVLVFIPGAAVPAFTPGVSCPAPGAPPAGSPIVGTTSAVDGTFTIQNVPVGTNIPLVIQTGRWRRQFVISTVTACVDNPQTGIRMPKNQTEGDIPKFAIATGSSDQVECALRKIGIDDSEFTDPSGTGRINVFTGSGSAGAQIDSATPSSNTLMGTLSTLEGYDVLMLPCEGGPYLKPAQQLANLIQFANDGGRVYASHYSYVWMYQNPPFNTVANWQVNGNQPSPDPGVATVDTSFYEGQTLAQWLQIVHATTTLGQMPISTLRKDQTGVVAPTQSYLRLNNTNAGNPVMQFVFDTPVGNTTNQCGRVLFNEYHVENPPSSPKGATFPAECSTAIITPQEKLLEYSIFELTADGSAATLTPATQDFGSSALGFNSNPQTFTWTNNSTFSSGVTLIKTTGDFAVTGSNCTAVAAGASCSIQVVFNPTVLGARTGVLTVGAPGSTLTSTLTGNGTPDLTVSVSNQDFGSVDVGAHASRSITVTNDAPGPVPLPAIVASGDFTVASTCGAAVPALSTCNLIVTFTPTATGPRTGTLSVSAVTTALAPLTAALTGNGVDFSLAVAPGSGNVIAGYSQTFTTTSTPIAGFAAPLTVSCATNLPASTCTVTPATYLSSGPANASVTVTTTSKYTVVGFSGLGGGSGLLWMVAVGTGGLLWFRRRSVTTGTASRALRGGLLVLTLVAATLSATGCSGLQPAQNPAYTPAGTYTLTISATDGFLVHSTTYSLKVTVN